MIKYIKKLSIENLILIALINIGFIQGIITIKLTTQYFISSLTFIFVLYFIGLLFNELLAFKLLKSHNLSILKKNVIKDFWIVSHSYVISVILLSLYVYFNVSYFDLKSEINNLSFVIKSFLFFLFFVINCIMIFNYTFKDNIITFIKSLFLSIIYFPFFTITFFISWMIIPIIPLYFTIKKYKNEKNTIKNN